LSTHPPVVLNEGGREAPREQRQRNKGDRECPLFTSHKSVRRPKVTSSGSDTVTISTILAPHKSNISLENTYYLRSFH
jgi:hypothetical protein